jgi:hypothetical protein
MQLGIATLNRIGGSPYGWDVLPGQAGLGENDVLILGDRMAGHQHAAGSILWRLYPVQGSWENWLGMIVD